MPGVVEEQSKAVVRGYPWFPQDRLAAEDTHFGPFVQHEAAADRMCDRHQIIAAKIALETETREVEIEAGEELGRFRLELELFAQLARQRPFRILTGLYAAAEQAPMARIPDVGAGSRSCIR